MKNCKEITSYTLQLENREYTDWSWVPDNACDNEILKNNNINIEPLENKLFHKDVIDINSKLISSPYREKDELCGVLLVSEKTYGHYNNSKMFYKCVPDDIKLPCFLVPFEEKINDFHKYKLDKYITFKIKEWNEKHPIGILTNIFGNVDNNEAYLTYQLKCKHLNSSIKNIGTFAHRAIREKSLSASSSASASLPLVYNECEIEDRRLLDIISIDPDGCTDIDDALGIRKICDDQYILSIYISNVPLILDYLNLWSYMSDRVSTIYLPNNKIPMLPAILSEDICSLKQDEERYALALDVYIKYGQIIDFKVKTVLIKVSTNYVYEQYELLINENYQNMFSIVRNLNKNCLEYIDDINDSHDVVEYCMLLMNHQCAIILKNNKTGIFRSAKKRSFQSENINEYYMFENLSPDFKCILQGSIGKYCLYDNDNCQPHELIGNGLDCYVHITSPIRRIVDCFNMIEIQRDTVLNSCKVDGFIDKWMNKVEFINEKTKAIRRLQTNMELLYRFEQNNQQIYVGFVFNKTPLFADADAHDDNKSLFKYKVYIPDIKILSTVTSPKDIVNYTAIDFTIHMFLDEYKMSKKIRLHMI